MAAHHDETVCAVRQPPFLRDMQDPRRIGLGEEVWSIPSDDRKKNMGWEMILDQVLHWSPAIR